jgi:hypothetical protein
MYKNWLEDLNNLLMGIMPSIIGMSSKEVKEYTRLVEFKTDRTLSKGDIELLSKIIKDWVKEYKGVFFKGIVQSNVGFNIIVRTNTKL